MKKWTFKRDPNTGLDVLVVKSDPKAVEKIEKLSRELFDEPCELNPGDVGCEECDGWVVTETLPPSSDHPLGWAVQKCRRKMDRVKE